MPFRFGPVHLVAERGSFSVFCSTKGKQRSEYDSATEQAFLVPQNLDEAETLVNKLTIEDLRAFCFTFGLSQDGTKASLKERLMEYYEEKFKSSLGSPVPMPRRRHSAESLKTTEKETLFSSALVDVEQRIDNLEFVVSQMREYMDESLKQFRVSLTESIKESTMRRHKRFALEVLFTLCFPLVGVIISLNVSRINEISFQRCLIKVVWIMLWVMARYCIHSIGHLFNHMFSSVSYFNLWRTQKFSFEEECAKKKTIYSRK